MIDELVGDAVRRAGLSARKPIPMFLVGMVAGIVATMAIVTRC